MSDNPSTIHKLTVTPQSETRRRKHNVSKFFASMRPGVLFAVVVISNFLIVGLGVFIGYHRFQNGFIEPETPIETAVAAILGLLAFLLAFTFSLTWSRFASRNVLVISHAKAIEVCWLRSSLIPEKQKLEVRRLLHEYITILTGLQTTNEFAKSLARLEEIQLSIWRQTATLVHEEVDSELRSLFISAVNELISLTKERKTRALYFQVPDAIWSSLLGLAVVGMLAFGYQAGISGMKKLFHLPLLPIAFGIVILLISDLNSTKSPRNFRVTQIPLLDVMHMMEKDIP
jgi:hypothetical protein